MSNSAGHGSYVCGGIEIALRVSFGNCCFFALHLLACLGMTKASSSSLRLQLAHAGLWLWRLLLWVGSIIGFFYVPANAVHGYGQFARAAGAVWLVLQMALLVILAYQINEWLLARSSHRAARAALVILSVICLALSLFIIAIGYRLYVPRLACRLNVFFVTITLLMGLVMLAILAVPRRAPTSGLLTSLGVWLYCSYLMYSGLTSEPETSNNCRRSTAANPYWVPAVAFALALAALSYSTFSAGLSGDDWLPRRAGEGVGGGSGGLFNGGSSGVLGGEYADDPEGVIALPYRADLFHFVFVTASAYAGMMFSSWRLSGPSESPFELGVGWASTWAKMGAKWFCEALYIWTVVAPALFPNRDFSHAIWSSSPETR